jgi:hypothetical protein
MLLSRAMQVLVAEVSTCLHDGLFSTDETEMEMIFRVLGYGRLV